MKLISSAAATASKVIVSAAPQPIWVARVSAVDEHHEAGRDRDGAGNVEAAALAF